MNLPSFDELVALLSDNPAEFESLRENLIEEEITHARPQFQRRLRGIQFQVECVRQTAKTPIASCLKIQEMLRASTADMRSLAHYHCGPTSNSTRNSNNYGRYVPLLEKGKVLEFRCADSRPPQT